MVSVLTLALQTTSATTRACTSLAATGLTIKSFFLNTVYESAHLHQMMKTCHEDFPKAPGTTSYLAVVPHMPNSTWWKTYAKEWEKIIVCPQGSLIFTARADTTFDSDNLQPAGAAGEPHRVFVSGSPWPVAGLYRDIHTKHP